MPCPHDDLEKAIKAAASIEEATRVLEHVLSGGFAVWTDDTLYFARQLVERVGPLRIEIYPREHPPPHFHVRGHGLNATFSVVDCKHLEGEIDGASRRLVEWWHRRCRALLVRVWNETRPSDCPVGAISE